MQKDIALKQLAEHEDVFAEIFNQLAFHGCQVVKPEHLISIPTEAFITEAEGVLREKRRDIVKADHNGQYYHLIFDLENQDRIDYTMPVRIMGYEFASYDKQIREISTENKKQEGSPIIDRLLEGQKLAPVISLILYWGKDTWDSPRCLHDMLHFSESAEGIIKPLVPDFPINLVCMAKLTEEQRQRLTTDIRVLADYVACQTDKQKKKNILREGFHHIRHSRETLTALSAIAGDRRYKQMVTAWEESTQKDEEGENMCEVLDEIFNDGKEEGLKEGLKEGIRALIEACREFGASREDTLTRILNRFSLPQKQVEEYMALYW